MSYSGNKHTYQTKSFLASLLSGLDEFGIFFTYMHFKISTDLHRAKQVKLFLL